MTEGRDSTSGEELAPELFAERLKQRYGETVDPEISLEDDGGASASELPNEILKRLEAHAPRETRYRIEGEVGRGGIGAILKVWDKDLHRRLAMKVALGPAGAPLRDGGGTSPKGLMRFLEEAQITSQLDHPGIVPIHELGLDSHGSVYFTMRLVRGRDLKRIFELVFEEQEGWNTTRALGVVLRVCEAMAYAHTKGVIHRDLKPSNVMVGRFGEAYVMDWGLARVLGREDTRDVRPRPDGASVSIVETDWTEHASGSADSALCTMDGDIVGTPIYMSPEQARGALEELGPHSDVYSVGAMLYHLLAQQPPFVPANARVAPYMVLMRLIEGPPRPLHELEPTVPAEVAAICEKAMARKASDRYADMQELADDLRNYLEHRVVQAYETGAVAELRKWVRRNRGVAAASAALVVALVVGLVTSLTLFRQAESSREELERKLAISDQLLLIALEGSLGDLWPATPAMLDEYDAWLARAEGLVERLPRHEARLALLRAGALPWSVEERERDQRAHPSAEQLRRKRARRDQLALSDDAADRERLESVASNIAELEARVDERATYTFEADADRREHDSLEQLVPDLIAFGDRDDGAIAELHRRRQFASVIEQDTVTGDRARSLWADAIADIGASPRYGGLTIVPQLGVLPLGPDPASGLWEFAHLQTGEPAQHSDGSLEIREETGLVFVLVPGGSFWMGAQTVNEAGVNFDPEAVEGESPVHRVSLDAYLISKFEMTQGQWLRATGSNPSAHRPGVEVAGKRHDLRHPVESVSWNDCTRVLTHLGLQLPTEAQWEHAARGGTATPYYTGRTFDSLEGFENVADVQSREVELPDNVLRPEVDDGYAFHAPVGSFRANPFGLYDVVGNVNEWCRDTFVGQAARIFRPGDGLREVAGVLERPYRGGAFNAFSFFHRPAHRRALIPIQLAPSLGVRPARAISP